jgi:hypothetical protein
VHFRAGKRVAGASASPALKAGEDVAGSATRQAAGFGSSRLGLLTSFSYDAAVGRNWGRDPLAAAGRARARGGLAL